MINLFISFYNELNHVRAAELEFCIKKNLENELINRIFIVLEGEKEKFPVLFHDKVFIIDKATRPTYSKFFNLINSSITDMEDINILCNTDIFFDDTLKFTEKMGPHDCFALSRWDWNEGNPILHRERFSQDTWIFKGKIKPVRYGEFYLGIPGCDNRIAYEIFKAGYRIINPCQTIKTYHYHKSDLHNYDHSHRIDKPYMPVEICGI